MEFNNVTTAPWEAKARELVATDPAFLRPLDPDDMGALAINSAQKAFDDAVAQVNLDVYEIVCEPQTYELLLQMGAAVCRFRGALDADGELDKFDGRTRTEEFENLVDFAFHKVPEGVDLVKLAAYRIVAGKISEAKEDAALAEELRKLEIILSSEKDCTKEKVTMVSQICVELDIGNMDIRHYERFAKIMSTANPGRFIPVDFGEEWLQYDEDKTWTEERMVEWFSMAKERSMEILKEKKDGTKD